VECDVRCGIVSGDQGMQEVSGLSIEFLGWGVGCWSRSSFCSRNQRECGEEDDRVEDNPLVRDGEDDDGLGLSAGWCLPAGLPPLLRLHL